MFLADDRAAYADLLRLAVTPASRRAAADILGALGRTERQWLKATAIAPVMVPVEKVI
jgi:hypothetical protein